MSIKNDLGLAYHMGYDDALAKRKPDASKTQILASDDLAEENSKLRELSEKAWKAAEMLCQAWDGPCHADGVSIKPPCPLNERDELCVYGQIQRDLRELGIEEES